MLGSARFGAALLAGLAWGVFAVIVLSGAALAMLSPIERLPFALIGALWFGLYAAAFAVFPIGPAGALIGWLVYKAGVVSKWAYAAVGAAAASTAAAALLFVTGVTFARIAYALSHLGESDHTLTTTLFALFPIVGAFGGYMGGRVIDRTSA